MHKSIIKELEQKALRSSGLEGLGGSYMEVDNEALIEETVRACIECIQLTMSRDGHNTSHYQQSTKHINAITEYFGVE